MEKPVNSAPIVRPLTPKERQDIIDQAKANNTAPNNIAQDVPIVYNFTQEELLFLQPRQQIVNDSQRIVQDIDYVMQKFILENTLPRLKIDPNENSVEFNVLQGTLTIKDNKPQIITPKAEIIKPS